MKARYKHQQTVTTMSGKTLTIHHEYEHSAPMTGRARIVRYYEQNGPERALTVRQQRAIRKADRRAVARASALLAQS